MKEDRIIKTILFVNTFEPVVPLYSDLFPLLIDLGILPKAIIINCKYRDVKAKDNKPGKWIRLWYPALLKTKRRWCSVFYWVLALIPILVGRYDKVVFLSQPPLFFIIGAWIARLKGIRYCLHIMDLYPDLLIKQRSIGYKRMFPAISIAATNVMRNADQVIVLGRCMEEVIREKGVSPRHIRIIENWPEKSVAETRGDGRKFKEEYGLENKLVVMYCGNMGRFHSFDTILMVAERLHHRGNIAFVFIGSGVQREKISYASSRKQNILLLDHQPIEEFSNILAAGDIHFISLKDGYEGLMVPSKFYSVVASGKPILYEGSDHGEIAKVIQEEHCGKVIKPGDTDSLEQAIVQYSCTPEMIAIEGENSRRAYEARFERNVLAKRYANIVAMGDSR